MDKRAALPPSIFKDEKGEEKKEKVSLLELLMKVLSEREKENKNKLLSTVE